MGLEYAGEVHSRQDGLSRILPNTTEQKEPVWTYSDGKSRSELFAGNVRILSMFKHFRFDMDMSYARVVRTASLTSYSVRCKM
jgi:hypothetical protein